MTVQDDAGYSPEGADPFNAQANTALLRYKVAQLERAIETRDRELERANEARDREVEELRREIQAIEERNAARDRERAALERKQLIWGITFLGGVVISLGTLIWNNLATIIGRPMP